MSIVKFFIFLFFKTFYVFSHFLEFFCTISKIFLSIYFFSRAGQQKDKNGDWNNLGMHNLFRLDKKSVY